MKVRTRFAPSPTGLLHIGNARTALFNWLFARHEGGTFILRIEDTDRERSRREFEEGIPRELSRLGIDWDEGIEKGPYGPYRQSARFALGIYREQLELLERDGHVYYCFCTTERLEEDREADRKAGRMPRYPGRCRSIPAEEARARRHSGEAAVARFRVPEGKVSFEDQVRGDVEVDSAFIGDPVLMRSDGWPTYNFAVVVDDIAMGITHVLRGEDHLSNTSRQILLYRALAAEPPRFAHLPLVLGPDGAPLSKRHGDTALQQLHEERGYLPEAVVNYLALLGWSPPDGKEVLSGEELIRKFDLSRISKAAGIFDRAKLDWLGNQHFRRTDSSRLAGLAVSRLQEGALLPAEVSDAMRGFVTRLIDLLKDSLSRFDQLLGSDAVSILFEFDPSRTLRDAEVGSVLGDPGTREVIQAFARRLDPSTRLDPNRYHRLTEEIGRETGTRGKGLYRPIRLALTGRLSGPELTRLIPLIEEGASLPLPRPVTPCAERAQRVAALLAEV